MESRHKQESIKGEFIGLIGSGSDSIDEMVGLAEILGCDGDDSEYKLSLIAILIRKFFNNQQDVDTFLLLLNLHDEYKYIKQIGKRLEEYIKRNGLGISVSALQKRRNGLVDRLVKRIFEQIKESETADEVVRRLLLDTKNYTARNQNLIKIREECKNVIHSQINNFIQSGIYLEERSSDVTFDIHSNLMQCSTKEFTREMVVNPDAKEDVFYSIVAATDFRGLKTEQIKEFVREFYRSDLAITVNKRPLWKYLMRLGKKYPDKYSDFTNITETWDVYSLLSINKRYDSAGIITDTIVAFNFPLDRNIERHEITYEYTSHAPLQIGRLGTVVRMYYPCKRLEDKYIVRFKNPETWEISFNVFEPFYSLKGDEQRVKDRSFTIDRIDKQVAVVNMNYLILPGTGYAVRVLLKEPINGGSLTPEFLKNLNC